MKGSSSRSRSRQRQKSPSPPLLYCCWHPFFYTGGFYVDGCETGTFSGPPRPQVQWGQDSDLCPSLNLSPRPPKEGGSSRLGVLQVQHVGQAASPTEETDAPPWLLVYTVPVGHPRVGLRPLQTFKSKTFAHNCFIPKSRHNAETEAYESGIHDIHDQPRSGFCTCHRLSVPYHDIVPTVRTAWEMNQQDDGLESLQ